MFSYAPPAVNHDGTRNVSCPQCKRFICKISGESKINTALCIICQAANRGEVLPPHVVEQYLSQNGLDVIFSDPNYDPLLERDVTSEEEVSESKSNGYFFKTVRVKVAAAIKAFTETKSAKPTKLVSQVIAQDKKRKRIFDGPIDE